ncbi:MAG TPA: metallophosphoesterase [Candidatus Kapabacteria bacterium]|jgi:3',5'-cyclic AMP phosphodiesterase CpdA
MRIAHLSDPHINLKFHPQHLPRLRRVLEHAMDRAKADHIVITGDLTSNADARDLLTVRRLFESLGILKSSKLTVVIGNHDIFGGPHLAEDLLGFPDKCRKLDYDEKVAIFQDTFAELFADTITMDATGYPFLKRVKEVCLMGFNSIARHSLIQNPVGSNGAISSTAHRQAIDLAQHHAWRKAGTRIALLHHHTFRPKDVAHLELPDAISRSGIAARIEQRTLKLHGKRALFKLFKAVDVHFAMHGHIHFTGTYVRESIPCSNGAGSVYPVFHGFGYYYNVIEVDGNTRSCTALKLDRRRASLPDAPITEASRFRNISETLNR